MATKAAKKATVNIKGTVKIILPKAPKGEDQYLFGSVNGKTFRIKRGVEVEVSPEVAEVIRNAERAREEAEAYEERTAH